MQGTRGSLGGPRCGPVSLYPQLPLCSGAELEDGAPPLPGPPVDPAPVSSSQVAPTTESAHQAVYQAAAASAAFL